VEATVVALTITALLVDVEGAALITPATQPSEVLEQLAKVTLVELEYSTTLLIMVLAEAVALALLVQMEHLLVVVELEEMAFLQAFQELL
jgi:hypothetical protein